MLLLAALTRLNATLNTVNERLAPKPLGQMPVKSEAGVKFTDYFGGGNGVQWTGVGAGGVLKIKVPAHLPRRTINYCNNSAVGGRVKITARLCGEVVFTADFFCANHLRCGLGGYDSVDTFNISVTSGQIDFFAYCDEIEWDDTASATLLAFPDVKSEAILPTQ